MGFNHNDLKFLLSGMDGSSICTLGRQTLLASQSSLNKVLSEFNKSPVQLPNRGVLFADDVLTPLGYQVWSMDASDYEKASIVHDLNIPVPSDLLERFDIVWDGGTLEHIFNFPVALANALRMVKIGGHFAARTPTNNQCGHGFYQFSPELFYRVLVPQNGFEIARLYVNSHGKFYHVKDPADARGRVELLDGEPALLVVDAKKIGPTPAHLTIPQQSDYVATWTADQNNDGRLKALLRSRLSPESIERISFQLNKMRLRRRIREFKKNSRLSNRKFYLPVTDWRQPTKQAFTTSSGVFQN